MTAAQLVLHLGAPKCGSSALQAALTARPDHAASGHRAAMRYVVGERQARGVMLRSGRAVQKRGAWSPYQYRSWPNIVAGVDSDPLFAAVRKAIEQGQRAGHVPILSCEGWITHPDRFAAALADMGHPQTDAVVYLRPPLDWVNAAWWQWGIWTVRSLDAWLDLGSMTYRFGPLLEQWAAIPNLRLHIRPARPDAVADFATLYGLDLPAAQARNSAVPPSLIGFFLRNRRFRPTPHDAAAEFVFQRWCSATGEARPWAVLPRHVHRLRPLVAETRTRLSLLMDKAAQEALFADPRWSSEAPYHAAILDGPSDLRDPEALPALFEALCDGVERVCAALGRPAPARPVSPPDGAPIEAWDTELAALVDTLLERDALYRLGPLRRVATGLYTRFSSG